MSNDIQEIQEITKLSAIIAIHDLLLNKELHAQGLIKHGDYLEFLEKNAEVYEQVKTQLDILMDRAIGGC